jgi:hypothetical protein
VAKLYHFEMINQIRSSKPPPYRPRLHQSLARVPRYASLFWYVHEETKMPNLTPAELAAEVGKLQEKRRAREAENAHRARKDIALLIGNCFCGSEIIYISTISFVSTDSNPSYGNGAPQGYYREKISCHCTGCALLYQSEAPRFKEIREKIKKDREPIKEA